MEQARSFFFRQLPAMIVARLEAFAALRGAIAFAVEGGSGWTVRLGDLDAPVVEGTDEKANLHLSFTPEALTGFLRGDAAAARNGMHAEGDIDLLADLGRLLEGPSTALGLRLKK